MTKDGFAPVCQRETLIPYIITTLYGCGCVDESAARRYAQHDHELSHLTHPFSRMVKEIVCQNTLYREEYEHFRSYHPLLGLIRAHADERLPFLLAEMRNLFIL